MDNLLVILIVALVIVIMVRGPKTIPLIGNMLGRGVKEVRKEAAEFQKERDATTGDDPTAPPTIPPTPPTPPTPTSPTSPTTPPAPPA
jgi:Sec-independent protein translocase protein TatA